MSDETTVKTRPSNQDQALIAALDAFVDSRQAIEHTVEFMRTQQDEEQARAAAERDAARKRRRRNVVLAVLAAVTLVFYLYRQAEDAQRRGQGITIGNKTLDRVESLLRATNEQNARLSAALDPNGCVARRAAAKTDLLIVSLQNTIHSDNGHSELIRQAPQAVVDDSKSVCPGDPGGPPILDAQGRAVPSPLPTTTTTTTPAPSPPSAASSTDGSSASPGPPLGTTSTTSAASESFRPPPSQTTPVAIPTPPGVPAPAPVQVPNLSSVLGVVTRPLCQLKLLCSPTS